jgi:pyruvate dehydrogenase E1 component alpha subunit
MNADPVTDPDDLFRYVYAEPTPALRSQQRELAAELARPAGHPGDVR